MGMRMCIDFYQKLFTVVKTIGTYLRTTFSSLLTVPFTKNDRLDYHLRWILLSKANQSLEFELYLISRPEAEFSAVKIPAVPP